MAMATLKHASLQTVLKGESYAKGVDVYRGIPYATTPKGRFTQSMMVDTLPAAEFDATKNG